MRSTTRLCLAAAAVATCTLTLASPVQADLFGVFVDGENSDLTVTGSSLLDLARNAADREGEFGQFENQAFTASFFYAGLEDAVILTSNADNSQITLNIPSINYTRTFDESQGDVGDQIEDFLRSDGSQVIADFIAVTNRETLVGVTDGNPSAVTSLLSNETFRLFGDFRNPFASHVQGADGLQLYAAGTSIDTDVGSGYLVEGALTSGFRFTDNVGLVLSSPVSYRNIEDSEAYTFGFIAGLPIKLTSELDDDQPLLWQITPNFHIAGGGSADQLSGGVIIGGGVTNLVGVKLGDFFLSSGQHFAGYGGQPIEVSDYRFETEVGQSVFKGSVALTYGGVGQSAYFTGGIVYTDLLDEAAVDNWITPFAALGLKLGDQSLLRIGYAADLAEDYTGHRAEAEIRFSM